ncbi:MAG TPA: hypothetical protein OIL95_13745 [Coprobacillaceae bacterium]|nr:hypothetical protein [Coprobacillaceae bacterium]
MFKIKKLLRNKKTDRVVTCINIAVITIAFINAFVWQSLWLSLAVVIESILSCFFLRLCRRECAKREAAKELIDRYFLESFEFIRDYVSIQKSIGRDVVSKLVTVKIKRNIDLFCLSLSENLISWEEYEFLRNCNYDLIDILTLEDEEYERMTNDEKIIR